MAMVDQDAKQRLLDLRVGEISLVDHPANEEEFLIIKRLEDDDMGQEALKENPEATAPPSEANNGDGASIDLDEVVKAAESLSVVLAKARPGMEEDYEEEGKKPGMKKQDMPPALKKALMDLWGMLKKLLGGYPEAKSTKKSLIFDEDDRPGRTKIFIEEDGSVVVKGVKQFSKERMTRLKTALGEILGLVKDADPDSFADLVASLDLAPSATDKRGKPDEKYPYPYPPKKKAGKEEDYEEEEKKKPMRKSDDELVAAVGKLTETVTENIATVNKRLDALEKGSAVSKSLPEGGSNDKPQPKTSLWRGVL